MHLPPLGIKKIETTWQIAAKEINVTSDFIIILQILALRKDMDLFMSNSIFITPLFTFFMSDITQKI